MPDLTPKTALREDLRARILCCDLAPGAELDETRLAREFGLSRTPLREVFQGLAGEGYLNLRPNKGAQVTPLDLPRLQDFMLTAPVLLTSAARLAAARATPGETDTLMVQLAALGAAFDGDDRRATALAAHGFWEALRDLAASTYLAPGLTRLALDMTRLNEGHFSPGSKKEKKALKKTVQAKQAVADAIAAQDAQGTADAVLALWEMSRERLTSTLQPDPLPTDATEKLTA